MHTINFTYGSVLYLKEKFPNTIFLQGYDKQLLGVFDERAVYISEGLITDDEHEGLDSLILYFSSFEDFPDFDINQLDEYFRGFIKQVLELSPEKRPVVINSLSINYDFMESGTIVQFG